MERRAYCFSTTVFLHRTSPGVRVITSIACPFSIRVHYGITGPLYEIHPLFPSSCAEHGLLMCFSFFPPCFPAPFNRGNKKYHAGSFISDVCMQSAPEMRVTGEIFFFFFSKVNEKCPFFEETKILELLW